LISYNCNGLKNNDFFVNKLIENNNILFLCETMTNDDTVQQDIITYHNVKLFEIKSIRSERGRPSKGSIWILPKELKCTFEQISNRISIVCLSNVILAGVYLPYFDGNQENKIEFEYEIELLKSLCRTSMQNGKSLVILGDFNADPSRNNAHDKILINFINEYNFSLLDKRSNSNVNPATYARNGLTSNIDHYLVLGNIKHDSECIVIEDIHDYSDHKAIQTWIEIDPKEIITQPNHERTIKINWKDKKLKKDYNHKVKNNLKEAAKLKQIVQSENYEELKDGIEQMIKKLNQVLLTSSNDATKEAKKYQNQNHIRKKHWFTKEIQQLHQQKANLYKEYKARNNDQLIKQWVNDHKTQIRKKKRENLKKQDENQVRKYNKLFNSDKLEFWKEIKKKDKTKSSVNIPIESLKSELKQLFNEKLIDAHLTESNSKLSIENYLNQNNDNDQSTFKLEKQDLICILKKLGNNKSIGYANVSNEHLKYGINDELVEWLVLIFEKIVNYNIIPSDFNIGIVRPIIKDESKSESDISNIRPITISDALTNIFEKILLLKLESTHKIHDKQFGFKSNNSCNHAFFALKESLLVNKTKKKNKKTYLCAIDASKAFDKVNRYILLDKIKNRMDFKIFKIIKNYYDNLRILVKNNGEQSDLIKTSIGVKQGGPLSPRLFAMYTEDLIEEIEKTEYGITIKETKTDIIMYADDIVLVANKLKDLEKLLKITEEYGKNQEIKFNPTKTTYMIFNSSKKESKHPQFDGVELKRVKSMRYLGIMLNDKLTNKEHINTRKKLSIKSNVRLNKYGYSNKMMDPSLKSSLYKCYTRSVLMYGMENTILRKNEIKQLQTQEAKLIKRSLQLSTRTKNTDLLYALNLEPIQQRDIYSKCKFMMRLLDNKYTNNIIKDLILYYYEEIGYLYKDSLVNQIFMFLKLELYDEETLLSKLISKTTEMEKENQLKQANENVIKLKDLLVPNHDTNKISKLIEAINIIN
jgi:hypothetical protein